VGRDLIGDPLERMIKEDKDVHEEPRISTDVTDEVWVTASQISEYGVLGVCVSALQGHLHNTEHHGLLW